MSASTPAASPTGGSPANANSQDVTQSANQVDRLVLDYLRARGHKNAEAALLETIENGNTEEAGKTVSPEDLVRGLAVFAQKPSRPGENVLKDSSNVLQELDTMGNPSSIQSLISSLGTTGAEDILSMDPTDKHEGFTELESWVEGSLDMYKVFYVEVERESDLTRMFDSRSFAQYFSRYSVISTSILCKRGSKKLVGVLPNFCVIPYPCISTRSTISCDIFAVIGTHA